jgi:hypothetical protein
MAKNVWSVLCHKGATHQRTNQISLLDVIEEITVVPQEILIEKPKAVTMQVSMELVSMWIRSDLSVPESSACRVRLVTPMRSKHYTDVLELDLKDHIRVRSTVQIDVIPYYGPGLYYFVVEQRRIADSKVQTWKTVAHVPLEIQVGQATLKPTKSKRTKK